MCSTYLPFFKNIFCIYMVHLYSSMNTAQKETCFISSDRSDFLMIDNFSIAFHTFTKCMSTSLWVEETLLPRYENWLTSLRGLPLLVVIAPSCLKHMNSVLFVFMWRAMPTAACSRLRRSDSVWASVFVRSVSSPA